ncbi:MAG: DUF1549 domain-containing protein [Verrucomicrobiota bacterium]|nr:DUF1549 domain-containing protein [Verrucomicrobiota bacterium]
MVKISFFLAFVSLLLPLSGELPHDSFSLSSKQVLQEASAIDRILDKAHRKQKLEIPSDLEDGQLLRRIYLTVAGRIPSFDETTAFLNHRSEDQKAMLVDYLLNSPAYESQMFNWWADLLRLQSRMRGGNQIGAGELYNHWVREQVMENTPFDQMAYSLVTAQGYPWEDGATGYYLRDAGMELDNMSNTTQLFLGTQMVCAQCHNHPFDKWTQREYYEMAAFTYGITTRMGGQLQNDLKTHFNKVNKNLSPQKRKQKAQSKQTAALRKALQEMIQPLRYGSRHTARQLTLPHDYQYDDAQPESRVSPAPIFGESLGVENADDKIEAYGQWLTSSENPRFTKVIANRMWKKIFGRGLVEPVDDWRDDTQASIPELLDHLEKLMVRVNYDLKEFQRVLLNVQAFDREAVRYEITNDQPHFFEGPVLKRMSAEQLWDSFVSLSIPYSDERIRDPQIIEDKLDRFAEYQEKVENLDPTAMVSLAGKAAKASRQTLGEMERIQKELREAQEADDREAVARLRREYTKARNQQRSLFAKIIMGDDFDVRSLYNRATSAIPKKDSRWKGYNTGLMRASEIPTPAPPGHFLREFGQSDREIIENSNRQASVPQALTLLNGVIYGAVFSPQSPLSQNLSRADSDEYKIRVLFLSLLNREPSDLEMADCLAEVGKKSNILAPSLKIPNDWPVEKKEKYRKNMEKKLQELASSDNKRFLGVAWALMNTRQFSFIQ